MDMHETIAAISTAVSESGIGIIRISGDHALEVADRVYASPGGNSHLVDKPSHTIHYGFIRDPEKKEVIDEVLVSIMRAPRSFTAEDTVEINCHGGVYAMKRVLEAVLKAGARAAEPGEFTKRAFLNGRIDLSQAEAIMDVIAAKNEMALRCAVSQVQGQVKKTIDDLRSRILYHTAKIESALDDPEHYSLEGYADQLLTDVRKMRLKLQELIDSADNGRLIKEGIQTVILGRPNAGKSSLMNRLLGQDRSIVTQIPGTTRDILTETMQLGEITLNLMDTAGIRQTEDLVEQIGVQRALDKIEEADLILYVVDSSEALTEDNAEIMRRIDGKKAVILLNKSDLSGVTNKDSMQQFARQMGISHIPYILSVSMKDGEGLKELETQVKEMFYHGEISFNDEVVITNTRHKHLLIQAKEDLQRVVSSIEDQMPEDFYTIDLMDGYKHLGDILGEEVNDDLADEIFERFCMGK